MPYRYNRHLSNRSNDLLNPFDDFFRSFFGTDVSTNAMRVDVKDEGDHYLLEADMPGIKKEDVSIEVNDGVLTISAQTKQSREEKKENYVFSERRSGSFSRSFTLNGIDEEKISAACEDGVLKLTLPKLGEEVKTGRRIEVQ
ncbi:MAG TPA: Hsp20/alpha crystallin family protein [Candidatus Excrementavichristensenella intestinipullorum]|nr:Hsp20/alpha crystallin family protein [Candidatus Excrementavichristensenella intestinipullorum]